MTIAIEKTRLLTPIGPVFGFLGERRARLGMKGFHWLGVTVKKCVRGGWYTPWKITFLDHVITLCDPSAQETSLLPQATLSFSPDCFVFAAVSSIPVDPWPII
jgi:hypothetical protein